MKKPIHQSDVPFESWYEGTDRETRGKPLCDVGGTARVGFGLTELSPGADSEARSPIPRLHANPLEVSRDDGRAVEFLGQRSL